MPAAAWVGLSDTVTEGTFTYTDGTPAVSDTCHTTTDNMQINSHIISSLIFNNKRITQLSCKCVPSAKFHCPLILNLESKDPQGSLRGFQGVRNNMIVRRNQLDPWALGSVTLNCTVYVLQDYLPWAHNQPDNWQGNEDCAHLRGNVDPGTLNDAICTATKAFICKKGLVPSNIVSDSDSVLLLVFKFQGAYVLDTRRVWESSACMGADGVRVFRPPSLHSLLCCSLPLKLNK